VNPILIFYLIAGIGLLAIFIFLRKQFIFGLTHGVAAVYHVAGITFAETRRRRILQAVILLAALMLVGLLAITGLSPAEGEKAIISGGLDLMLLLGTVLAVFICAFLIPTDIDKRTVYTVLSKPIKRWEFVLGKYFGALAVLGLLIAIMLLVQIIVLLVTHSYFDFQIILAAALIYIGIAVFAASVMTISTIASSLTTVIAGFVLWMLGSIQSMAHSLIENNATGVSKIVLNFVGSLVVNLDRYNFRDTVADGMKIDLSLAGQALLYGVGYVIVALIIGSLLFNERQV
jgi:ABC-type transport system involved in multi-copper enzyme maturation permease subunit